MHKGIPASPGIAIGQAFLYDPAEIRIIRSAINKDQVDSEIARFKEALEKTRGELLAIKNRVGKEIGDEHASIFGAHLLILDDPVFTRDAIDEVKQNLVNVEYAFSQSLHRLVKMIASLDGDYLRDRSVDITDVGRRILRNLTGRERETLSSMKEKAIVFARDLSPSDTATMNKQMVLGFATDIGGRTSHTAIMARALEIPAVVGLSNIVDAVKDGDTVIVDGTHGEVIVNPDEEALKQYQKETDEFVSLEHDLERLRDLPSETRDGHKIELVANIEIPEEIELVHKHRVKGIGLYRTEFLYLNRQDIPTEEEQFRAYSSVAKSLAPDPVIIRTLDLGGDKFLSRPGLSEEMNPFLGLRAIRLCLARPDIFKTQLRAILRAGTYGNLKVMFPMISSIEEVRKAMALVDEAKDELKKNDKPYGENVEFGVMIEVPSAVWIADILAKEVKFFSIGTNDLIQYTLAIDRADENTSYLYEPLHPAVLRTIRSIVDAGHKAGIWVGMCGEMAGDSLFTSILIGLGMDELSVAPTAAPEVKEVIRATTMKEASDLTNEILGMSTTAESEKCLLDTIAKKSPKLYAEIQKKRRLSNG